MKPSVIKQSEGRVRAEGDAKSAQRLKEEMLDRAWRDIDEKNRHPGAPQRYLPNYRTGPGLPQPIGINFYEERDYYPGYLLCTYAVQEEHYDPANEPAWFESALLQIRGYGRDRFPGFKWVAVLICNRAEHKGVDTFEKSYKVGAIFDINVILDPSRSLRSLIARAKLDRHPLVYDPNQPTPGKQQRWIIVERHAREHLGAKVDNAVGSGEKPPSLRANESSGRPYRKEDNLRRLALALQKYHDSRLHLPSAAVMGPDGKTPHSWRVELLPFLDQQSLYGRYELNEPWDSPTNKALLEQIPDVFRSPNDAPKSTNSG